MADIDDFFKKKDKKKDKKKKKKGGKGGFAAIKASDAAEVLTLRGKPAETVAEALKQKKASGEDSEWNSEVKVHKAERLATGEVVKLVKVMKDTRIQESAETGPTANFAQASQHIKPKEAGEEGEPEPEPEPEPEAEAPGEKKPALYRPKHLTANANARAAMGRKTKFQYTNELFPTLGTEVEEPEQPRGPSIGAGGSVRMSGLGAGSGAYVAGGGRAMGGGGGMSMGAGAGMGAGRPAGASTGGKYVPRHLR